MEWKRVAASFAALALMPAGASAQKVMDRSLAEIDVDPAKVETPKLQFTESEEDKSGYDKYFYFVRDDTDFATAYRDIRECDALARGVGIYLGTSEVPYPYAGTLTGALGGAIGSAVADAIFGSAERRKQRRTNLRTCMGYKGYSRYGLNKELWQAFNFEEGNGTVPDDRRQQFLQKQAKAAVSGRPATKELDF
jgi:hypothetical protein